MIYGGFQIHCSQKNLYNIEHYYEWGLSKKILLSRQSHNAWTWKPSKLLMKRENLKSSFIVRIILVVLRADNKARTISKYKLKKFIQIMLNISLSITINTKNLPVKLFNKILIFDSCFIKIKLLGI